MHQRFKNYVSENYKKDPFKMICINSIIDIFESNNMMITYNIIDQNLNYEISGKPIIFEKYFTIGKKACIYFDTKTLMFFSNKFLKYYCFHIKHDHLYFQVDFIPELLKEIMKNFYYSRLTHNERLEYIGALNCIKKTISNRHMNKIAGMKTFFDEYKHWKYNFKDMRNDIKINFKFN